MSLIRSTFGGGFVAETEVNGKKLVSEFPDIVAAAVWVEDVTKAYKEECSNEESDL